MLFFLEVQPEYCRKSGKASDHPEDLAGRAAPLTVLAELNAALDPTYVRTLVRRLRAGEALDERRIIKAHLMEVVDKLAALEPAAMPEGVEPSLAPVLGRLDATRAWYGREHPPADAVWRRFPLETVLGTVDRIAADLAALRQVLEQRLREASRAEERELEVAPEQEPLSDCASVSARP